MTERIALYVVQRKLQGSTEWSWLLSYPGGGYVGMTPLLEECNHLIAADKGSMNLFINGAEYRILKMEAPCEVII